MSEGLTASPRSNALLTGLKEQREFSLTERRVYIGRGGNPAGCRGLKSVDSVVGTVGDKSIVPAWRFSGALAAAPIDALQA